MESPAIAACGIARRRDVFREHERRYTADLALVGECHEVEHQFKMFFEGFRSSHRRVGNLNLGGTGLSLRQFDPALDLADVVQVSVDPCAIGRGQSLLQALSLFDDRIQNAAVLFLAREALLGGSSIAE